jgi:hypothetical protein
LVIAVDIFLTFPSFGPYFQQGRVVANKADDTLVPKFAVFASIFRQLTKAMSD